MSNQSSDAQPRLEADELDRMLTASAREADLDRALSQLQGRIGQATGDVAAAVFSRFADERAWWAEADAPARREILVDYLRAERLHGDAAIRETLAGLSEAREEDAPSP